MLTKKVVTFFQSFLAINVSALWMTSSKTLRDDVIQKGWRELVKPCGTSSVEFGTYVLLGSWFSLQIHRVEQVITNYAYWYRSLCSRQMFQNPLSVYKCLYMNALYIVDHQLYWYSVTFVKSPQLIGRSVTGMITRWFAVVLLNEWVSN